MRWQPVAVGVGVVAVVAGAGAVWVQSQQRPPPPPPPVPVEEPIEVDDTTGTTGDTGAGCTADTGLVGEVAAAAPATGPDGAPLEPLDLPACADPASAGRPLVLKPAKPVDAIAEVVVDLTGKATTTPISGALCEKATTPERCATLVARPPPQDGIARARHRRSLLAWTAGDEVGWARTPDELLAFLGPIDTADEAALVAAAGVEEAAYQVPCLPEGARATPEGFELFVRSGMCADEREHRVLVKADGTVSQRFAATPEAPLDCRCGLDARPPHLEDTFTTARQEEARLAAAALASGAEADWAAYLEASPMGPRAARARHAVTTAVLTRMKDERDRLTWAEELVAVDGDAELLWIGSRAAVMGVKLGQAAVTRAEDGGWTLSVEVAHGGRKPLKNPAIWFDLHAADGTLVDQRLELTEGVVVAPGATQTLSWPVEAGGVHPDATRAAAWFVAFE